MKIIYSPKADLGWSGIKCLHPFDVCKYSRAWRLLEQSYGASLKRLAVDPTPWLTRAFELLPEVHTASYLASLKKPKTIAGIIEIPPVRWVPYTFLRRGVLDPMMIACAGTCAAAEIAFEEGFTFNFGGGYHHAFADHGEGFCVFNDIAIARKHLINLGMLGREDSVWIIDLDAHRGNGNEDIFYPNANIHFLDLYNTETYPGPLRDKVRFPHLNGVLEHMAVARADRPRRSTELYLKSLKTELANFIAVSPRPRIVFYNAGTDIVVDDPLGRLSVSDEGVAERDRHVIHTLRDLGLPTVTLTSGGYTDKSHRLIAGTAAWALESYAGLKPGPHASLR